MTTTYQPCPFCGSTDLRHVSETWDQLGRQEPLIECRFCDAQARREWWNQRSPMAEVTQIMNEVKSV